ncbi:MAG TPA: DUF3570 domain-containing protein [Kofleriaceae bacterium]|jgi:hypothetical protein|nr:DUF3570 domain-containing protein [Kofleriaceae bacterium]
MRLQLTLAALVVAAPASARAQTAFSSKVQVYVDGDHTEVVSPLVRAQADVGTATNVSASYVADVVSSASVDVVSQASPATVHDTRHQVAMAVTQDLGEQTVHAAYLFSIENDYRSHTLELGGERRLAGGSATVAAGYSLSLDRVGRADDDNFHRSLAVHGASASFTQILSPRTIAQVTVTGGAAFGFQASPYRFVPVRADMDAEPAYWVAETDPDHRWRGAVVAELNRFVLRDSAVHADYRHYRDTWGITSHTFGAGYSVNLSPGVELRLRNRFYTQSGASFYRARYDQTMRYMTIDRELGPLWSETLGAKLMARVGHRAEIEVKADGFYFRYLDFPLLRSRLGANLGIGVQLTY